MWKLAQTPLASEAQQNASDNASDALSRLTEKMGELRATLATIRPEYQYTAPRTFGGVPSTTPYSLRSPFGSPCEVAIVSIQDYSSSAQALLLTTAPGQLASQWGATANMTFSLDGAGDWFWPTVVTGQWAFLPPPYWFPMRGDDMLYLYLGGSNTQGTYVTVQFRRRINPVGVPSSGY